MLRNFTFSDVSYSSRSGLYNKHELIYVYGQLRYDDDFLPGDTR
jgi:hypothetical protein